MISIIHCRNCDKIGALNASIKFTYDTKICSLQHIHSSDWGFHFCNEKCMIDWIHNENIESLGFPCQNCKSTGFLAGFPQNPKCVSCNGTGRVKSS